MQDTDKYLTGAFSISIRLCLLQADIFKCLTCTSYTTNAVILSVVAVLSENSWKKTNKRLCIFIDILYWRLAAATKSRHLLHHFFGTFSNLIHNPLGEAAFRKVFLRPGQDVITYFSPNSICFQSTWVACITYGAPLPFFFLMPPLSQILQNPFSFIGYFVFLSAKFLQSAEFLMYRHEMFKSKDISNIESISCGAVPRSPCLATHRKMSSDSITKLEILFDTPSSSFLINSRRFHCRTGKCILLTDHVTWFFCVTLMWIHTATTYTDTAYCCCLFSS